MISDTGMPKEITDSIDEKTLKMLRAIIMNFSTEIEKNIEMRTKKNIGNITNVLITNVSKHLGAGGKTFIIQGKFQSTRLGLVSGGIVIKFASTDLENEIKNANALEKLLKRRQKEWIEGKRSLPEKMKWIPETLFSPKILATYANSNCLILEFLDQCTPLIVSKESDLEKFMILGYALGRLHGSDKITVAMQLYDPMFRILTPFIDKETLDYWYWIIENSKGGVMFIHGDSHLENLLRVGKTALAWIDAQMIPRSERFDDLGYAISHAIQEEIAEKINLEGQKLTDFVQKLVEKYVKQIIPVTISAYKQTCSLSGIYSNELPIDFFLGAHLIIRSELWEQEVKDALIYLGKYYINQRPVNYMLKTLSGE